MHRRTMLALALAATLTSLAPARAQDRLPLEIGYLPILPTAQLFVGLEDGSIAKAGIEPKLVSFQDGPAMVQAILAGQLDVAYVGIGPVLVARAKGAPIRVVAANVVDQIKFVALDKLAPLFKDGDPATAFKRFAEKFGRKPVITTLPAGSVPDTVLQYWLRKQLKIDPSLVEVIHQGIPQVQQALLTGAVDGASILEPAATIVTERNKQAAIAVQGSAMFPRLPGAVLVVRQAVIDKYADKVQALVAAHEAASQALNTDSARVAPFVQKYAGGGRIELPVVEKALANSKGGFVADPDFIVAGTQALQDFQIETGTVKDKVDLVALFEPKFYRALKKK